MRKYNVVHDTLYPYKKKKTDATTTKKQIQWQNMINTSNSPSSKDTLSVFLMKISVNCTPSSASEAVWPGSWPPSSNQINKINKN